jgi:hypothetical protein
MLEVKIVQLPGAMRVVHVDAGTTVGAALRLAEVSATGKTIKVDGREANADTQITGNATVVLTAKITGNR